MRNLAALQIPRLSKAAGVLKPFAVAAVLALWGVMPASAQMGVPGIALGGSDKPKLTPEQQEKQDRLDRAYKAATESRPDQTAKTIDPWGNVRTTSPAHTTTEKPGRSRRER